MPKVRTTVYFMALCGLAGAVLLPNTARGAFVGDTLGGQALFGVFHEDGSATINGTAVQAFADPATGAPTWILPVSVVPGDVLITEPAAEGGGLSDLLRFPEVVQGISDRVMLFSDLPEPGEAPVMADVGLPTVFQANQVTIPEINGFADYDVPGGVVDYHVFSEEVPEPATLTGLGLLCCGLLARRRRL